MRTDIPIPAAPYLDRRVRDVPNLAEVWSYINPFMLYGRHLGFKGNFEKLLAERDPKALELFHEVEEVKEEAAQFMKVRTRCGSSSKPSATATPFSSVRAGRARRPLHTFQFGRQPRADGLCLSDYILDAEEGRRDHLAMFVVTAGASARANPRSQAGAANFSRRTRCRRWRSKRPKAARSGCIAAFAKIGAFPIRRRMTMQERFTSRYRGKRYSFGYPACPNLDDQQGIWKLLHPEEIGVQLTEGMMMDPEASVSALVFHHPDCAYFTASEVNEPALVS